MGVVTWHCSGVVETENPWKLVSDARWPRRCTPVPGVARWWTPIRGGVRVLLAENTRNTSGHRAALLWKKENHNCESLAVMSAIILIKNKAPPPLPFMHQVSSVSRSGFSLIGVFCILLRRLMQLVCRVSCWRRAMIRGSPRLDHSNRWCFLGRNLGFLRTCESTTVASGKLSMWRIGRSEIRRVSCDF